jgi:hypothetical protein
VDVAFEAFLRDDEPGNSNKLQGRCAMPTHRSDRYRAFQDFCAEADTVFKGLATQDPRHADLTKVYSFYVCPGGAMGGTDKRLLEIFYGSRPFDQVSQIQQSPNAPAHVSKQFLAESGARLRLVRADSGLVTCLLIPAVTEAYRAREDSILLEEFLEPAKLPGRAAAHWRALSSYMQRPQDVDATLGGLIFDTLCARVADGVGLPFGQYIKDHRTDRWLLFSDYVLKQPHRPNDVFAFTLVPGGNYLPAFTRDFEATARRDFKDVKSVSEPMIRLLSDPRLFSFCFIVDPSRVLTRNVAAVRGMLDWSIARLEMKKDKDLREGELGKLKALRRKAATQGFNVRLFDNMILAATFAAFLSYLICSYRRATRIGWFSDRDDITASHQAFVHHLYASDVVAFCHRYLRGWAGPALGVNAPVEPGGSLWCDAFLRVPDYLAGTVSAWNIDQDRIPSALKYRQILRDGIADHSNVQLIRVAFKHENDLISALSQSLAVTRK